MNEVELTINATLGQEAAAKVEGLENKVKASMKAVIEGDWMAPPEDSLFRAGVGGALLDVGKDSEDGKRLLASIKAIQKLNVMLMAAQAGLSVGIEGLAPEEGEPETLPLMPWWNEVKAATRKHPCLRY